MLLSILQISSSFDEFSWNFCAWFSRMIGPSLLKMRRPLVYLLIKNILGFNSVVFSVVDDVPVDSETSMVTSSISKICQLSLIHRSKIYVHAFIRMCVRAL